MPAMALIGARDVAVGLVALARRCVLRACPDRISVFSRLFDRLGHHGTGGSRPPKPEYGAPVVGAEEAHGETIEDFAAARHTFAGLLAFFGETGYQTATFSGVPWARGACWTMNP